MLILKTTGKAKNALQITSSAITKAIRLLHVLNRHGLLKEDADFLKGYEKEYIDTNSIKSEIGYDHMSIYATPEGGICFSWGCYIDLFEVVIPPEEKAAILYEDGWIDEDAKPVAKYQLGERVYTYNYEEIADKLKESQSACL